MLSVADCCEAELTKQSFRSVVLENLKSSEKMTSRNTVTLAK